MNRALISDELVFLHTELAADWRKHEEQIRNLWTLRTPQERRECLHFAVHLQDALPGDPIRDPNLTPEWNDQIGESGPRYFLDLAESRATRSLYQQSFVPFQTFESDYAHVVQMMSKGQASFPKALRNQRMLFVGEKQDGAVLDIATHTVWLRKLAQHAEHGVGIRAVPMACGELMIRRQLQSLRNIFFIISRIMMWGHQLPHPENRLELEVAAEIVTSSPKLAVVGNCLGQPAMTKLLLPGLIGRALDSICYMEYFKSSFSSQPRDFSAYLAHYICTEPAKLQPMNGPAPAPSSVGAILFDCVNDDGKVLCTWQYMIELLCLLHSEFDNEAFRHEALEQILHVCQLAYAQAHSLFVRMFRAWMTDGYSSAIERQHLEMNVSRPQQPTPDDLLRSLQRLAQEKAFTNATLDLVSQTAAFTGIDFKNRRFGGEVEAFRRLKQVVVFMSDLFMVLPMPIRSETRDNHFVLELQQAEARLVRARPHIDIGDFGLELMLFPTASMVTSYHATLGACTRKHASDSISDTYDAVVNKCLLRLKSRRSCPASRTQPGSSRTQPGSSRTQPGSPGESPPPPDIKSPAQPRRRAPETKEERKPSAVHAKTTTVSAPRASEEYSKPAAVHAPDTKLSGSVSKQEAVAQKKSAAAPDETASISAAIPGKQPEVEMSAASVPVKTVALPASIIKKEEAKEETNEKTKQAETQFEAPTIPLHAQPPKAKEETKSTVAHTTPVPKEKSQKKPKSAFKPRPKGSDSTTAKKCRQTTAPAKAPPRRKIKVSAATAHVFSVLFEKSLSHSGLHWASFEAAMAELEFRITPRQGSIILFEPPASLGLGRSLNVHRPHGSRVEGFRTVVLRQRLTRAYGWDVDTFVRR